MLESHTSVLRILAFLGGLGINAVCIGQVPSHQIHKGVSNGLSNGTTTSWASSGMFEDQSDWVFGQYLHPIFDRYQPSFAPSGTDIILTSTVDYDLEIPNDGLRDIQVRTPVEGLEIAKNGIIRGRNIWIRPGTEGGSTGSFINNGTIRSEDGDIRIQGTANFGTVHAQSGVISMNGSNDGTFLVTQNALFTTTVSQNGITSTFENRGLIDVRGAGAVYRVQGFSSSIGDASLDRWSNSGTLRVTEGATAQFALMNIADLGNLERDASARIEVTGYVNIGSGVLDRDTFDGTVHLTNHEMLNSGQTGGVFYNGQLDISGDWLQFEGIRSGLKDVQVIGGDLVIDPGSYGGGETTVVLQNIDIRDGDLVLGDNGNVRFDTVVNNDNTNFFNNRIRTITTGGQQSFVGLGQQDRLHLGMDAHIQGNIALASAAGASALIYNEGVILASNSTGRITIGSSTENHGLIQILSSSITANATFRNEGLIEIDFGILNAFNFENNATMIITRNSAIRMNRDFTLHEDSEISIDALSFQPSITAVGTITLDGILNLDLTRIVNEGDFVLFTAQEVMGNFDTINITGLRDGLIFAGLNTQAGIYSIIPTPSSFACLGFGVMMMGSRRRVRS